MKISVGGKNRVDKWWWCSTGNSTNPRRNNKQDKVASRCCWCAWENTICARAHTAFAHMVLIHKKFYIGNKVVVLFKLRYCWKWKAVHVAIFKMYCRTSLWWRFVNVDILNIFWAVQLYTKLGSHTSASKDKLFPHLSIKLWCRAVVFYYISWDDLFSMYYLVVHETLAASKTPCRLVGF